MNRIDRFHNQVGVLVPDDVWNINLPTIKVDQEQKEKLRKNKNRIRGSVRLRNSLFNTDEENKIIRKRVLSTPLP